MAAAPLQTIVGRLASAQTSARIDGAAIQQALGLRSLYLAERLLVALDFSRRGFGNAQEFAAAAEAVMAGGLEAKLGFLFRLHDHDGDGRLSREELERLLHISLAENDLELPEAVTTRMLDAIWSGGDLDGSGTLTFDEFTAMVAHRPELQAQLEQYGVALLTPGRRAREATAPVRPPTRRSQPWSRNTVVFVAFLVLYGLANVALFGEAVWRYRMQGANVWVQIARGCGACLNFNGALVLVPMLRHTLSWVRRQRWGVVLPVDEGIEIHRLVAEVMFGLALVHTVAHVTNILVYLDASAWSKLANVTGVALLWVFVLMWLFSRERVRRSGSFEAFHFSHMLYFVWFGLMLVHGPVFWMWVLLPGVGYAVERLVRESTRSQPTTLLEARILPSGVTRLDIARPRTFAYQPGDYVFIKIPAISRHEWHPFTLTSAPEDPHRLSVHVRSLGNWTAAVHEYFLPPGATVPRGTRTIRRKRQLPADRPLEGIPVFVDGPYGTPSSSMLQCRHVVMIGAGIGVTPFASVLQSIWLRRRAMGATEALQKVHFVWLSSDQHAFEWFTELLSQLEASDHAGLFDIHIYLTGARADMGGGTLDLARAMLYDHTMSDVVTGLRARTHFGRPDFDALLTRFEATPGLPKPEVFLCGPAPLARSVGKLCARHGLVFRHERF
ncbi:EF-hand domain-containing protein [Paraliomyxa miuraensis]|uniref:EF-hand domain-containing protein n=1 Tax=Paraliomyxa miuraensis TaxID=376150 RepID=UPI00225BA4D1|nr:EF-hand domain-containing protein [Paraliomyxa miuraensis]